MDFNARYKKLNNAQQSAVDLIDGPVMVIAGPGTGKTELLGMRAANILRQTDVLPDNILCLTFTEAGSIAMQKRLIDIIGRDAYNLSIFTFHAFGTEIMSKYREYFYNGKIFRPADDLARNRIVTEILDSLEYNNPLRGQMNGKYTAIGDIMSAISDLKRAGLTNSEFGMLLDATQNTIDIAGPILSNVFSDRISKSTRDTLADAVVQIESIDEDMPIEGIASLQEVLSSSIRHALEAADAHEKVTPPLTEWKKEWMTAGATKAQVLKIQKSLPKLRALNYVYSCYLQKMEQEELIDFDDMIMQVVHAIEVNDDLRYDLQEKYQYIMVDEFQDTNLAQMRILHNLINNPVVEDTPNILVVGDDDQAIYGFQGAEVGNILYFRHSYPKTRLITLTENYRSVQPVLDSARDVITQGSKRLENHMTELNKTLTANLQATSNTELVNFASTHDERKWIASSVRSLIDSGIAPNEIAIIARKHADLVSLLGYLNEKNIPISYDRRDSVLDDEIITQLEDVGLIVQAISIGQHDEANALLPELLCHPAWGIDPMTVWDISLQAQKNHEQWLETMRNHDATKQFFEWLISAAGQALHLPLERMIDILIGNSTLNDTFTSPLKDYFFAEQEQQTDIASYAAHLENLSTIRQRLRDHTANVTSPKLADFLEFMNVCRQANISIVSEHRIGEDGTAVQLLSAHGSKGLEFDHVFIINATDSIWGEKVKDKSASIVFPPHLRLRKYDSDYSERLRLFYVAMTRARHGLHVTYSGLSDGGKEQLRASFLLGSTLSRREETADYSEENREQAAEHLWYAPIVNIPPVSMREYLAPRLRRYKLSATHINSFVDVTRGGPQHFLLNTLLKFPSAPSAVANYGTAIHSTLQRVHDHMRATGSMLPEEDILHEFEKHMDDMALTDDERRHYVQKGTDALTLFMNAKSGSFSTQQQAELDFSRQDVVLNDARLTGKIDVVQFDKATKTAVVIDYKTGGALAAWDKGIDYQKIRAHKYRQQLLFYKFLIENSRDYRYYTMKEGILQFVEPDAAGRIVDLRLRTVDPEELDRFVRLIRAVWTHINDLSFPDTSNYEQSVEGIKKFEEDLLTSSK